MIHSLQGNTKQQWRFHLKPWEPGGYKIFQMLEEKDYKL